MTTTRKDVTTIFLKKFIFYYSHIHLFRMIKKCSTQLLIYFWKLLTNNTANEIKS